MYMALIFLATSAPCALVTGVSPCVLRSSIHVRLLRRSDLRPQRMIGVVGQKWRTSGYHWEHVSDDTMLAPLVAGLPYLGHSRVSSDSQSQSIQRAGPSRGMKAASNDHILPVQRYPTAQARRPCQKACALQW